MPKTKKSNQQKDTEHRTPVVSLLGHVDHGKTTLLDAVRKTSIADREIGGITQKIGASSVEIIHDGEKRSITFIDTPGHEAFSKMRGRGAGVADIALLIVAATEGLKPQTKESIDILKKTKTRFIVVLTKADLPNKNLSKVKQELMKEQIALEEYGGDVPLIEVSAKANQNIKELLDLILLIFDLNSENTQDIENKSKRLEATVIESKLDPKTGPLATIVVKNGLLSVRDEVSVEGVKGKIKAILDDKGQRLNTAQAGQAVEILGLEKVPSVGSLLNLTADSGDTKIDNQPTRMLKRELVYQKQEDHEGISVILVADTQGSLEAITHALPEEAKILSQKTGDVSEADIMMAKSTRSIVLSFNTRIKPDIQRLAMNEKILLRNYTIIYEMLDELNDAIEGKLQSQMEQILGKAQVLAIFPYEKTNAYGIKVIEGRVAKGDRIRIERSDAVIGETGISSLRIGKNATSKVEKGNESGIVISSSLDIRIGDMLISHS